MTIVLANSYSLVLGYNLRQGLH